MKKIKISITIPAFKKAYLAEALQSCLEQTYDNYEVIIVDDASPEDLKSIVDSFSSPKISYYRNSKNTGALNVVNNWNLCLEYASGDYIICMGDDDMLFPNCLQTYVRLIEKYPSLNVYHGWTEIIDEDSQFSNFQAQRPEWESVYSLIWHRWENRKTQFIGDFLFDCKYLRHLGGFYFLPLAWGSDDITAVIAAKEKGIANTQELCFKYRVNSKTISSTGNTLTKCKAIRKEEAWYLDFLKEYPSNPIDQKYYQLIKDMLPLHFEKKINHAIYKDMNQHLSRLWFWLVHSRKIGVPYCSVLKLCIKAFA